MTCPPPIEVTRPIERNTRRRRRDLDDEPDDAGQRPCGTQHDDVAHLAHPVADGVEHVGPGKAGDEDPGPALLTSVSLDRPPDAPDTAASCSRDRHRTGDPAALGEDGGMSFSGSARTPRDPTLPQGETVAAYGTYLEAQRAVAHLAEKDFPVQLVTIVGTDLRMVERVTGRLSYPGRSGAVSSPARGSGCSSGSS